MAGFDSSPQTRTAADPRHRDAANILFVDGHAQAMTLERLGYRYGSNGGIGYDGDNTLWSGNGHDIAWTPEFRPGD